MSFCLDTYLQQSDDYEIHASKAGFKDCAMIIRFKADELVYIKPGDEVLGVRVIGIPPIPIGFDKTKGTEIEKSAITAERLLLSFQSMKKKLKRLKNLILVIKNEIYSCR